MPVVGLKRSSIVVIWAMMKAIFGGCENKRMMFCDLFGVSEVWVLSE